MAAITRRLRKNAMLWDLESRGTVFEARPRCMRRLMLAWWSDPVLARLPWYKATLRRLRDRVTGWVGL